VPIQLKLIVGLGNPGPAYSATRHNVGFRFVEKLAARYQTPFSLEKKFHGYSAGINSSVGDCRLFMPATFMNDSGQAVQAVSGYYGIANEAILVVHDEIDLDAGTIRLKKGGGHGGHNGLRDISEKLGHGDYLRLRIGVGHPGEKTRVTSHVLSRPTGEDEELINQSIERGIDILPLLFSGEMNKAMTRLNSRQKSPASEDKPT